MKRELNKSGCPVNYTVELLGDTWTMLILRDIAVFGKHSFNAFLESPEKVGTSVLTAKLNRLLSEGILRKEIDPEDRRRGRYFLTEKGYTLLPLLYETVLWGLTFGPSAQKPDFVLHKVAKVDKEKVLATWRKALDAGSCVFFGEQSLLKLLGLQE